VSIIRRLKQAAEPTPPLITRPPLGDSMYAGAEIIKDIALLRWETGYGGVGLAYSLDGGSNHPNRLLERIWYVGTRFPYRYSAIVAPQFQWDLWGPELLAIDTRRDGWTDAYSTAWQQLADIFGTAVPLWHDRLLDRDSILAWHPGAPAAVVPAFNDEFRTEPFLALAADEPDGSPVIPLCLWLARTYRDDLTEQAWHFINMLAALPKEVPRRWTLAAIPMELRRPEAEPPSLQDRREGWWQILNRRDTLAAKVALLGEMWDGGRDWPAGPMTKVRPKKCPTAALWAARLDPTPNKSPTVLEQRLLSSIDLADRKSELLQDPATGLPAMYCSDHTQGEYVSTLGPQWLSTDSPLSSVTLSDGTAWITTADQGVWIAPESPGVGLNWGYHGGGPMTLANLLNQLLDNITSPAVDAYPIPPVGLFRLVRYASGPLTYTREQLEEARKEPPTPGKEWWDVDDSVDPGAGEPAGKEK
jgi:hypothetical protein